MNVNIVETQPGDIVITPIDVGNIPPSEVDAYCKKNGDLLKDVFGCEVVLLPVRGTDCWDFTIIRKSKTKKSKKV